VRGQCRVIFTLLCLVGLPAVKLLNRRVRVFPWLLRLRQGAEEEAANGFLVIVPLSMQCGDWKSVCEQFAGHLAHIVELRKACRILARKPKRGRER
jgi:hypothetical protein